LDVANRIKIAVVTIDRADALTSHLHNRAAVLEVEVGRLEQIDGSQDRLLVQDTQSASSE